MAIKTGPLRQCSVCTAIKSTSAFPNKKDMRCTRCVGISDRLRKCLDDTKYGIKMMNALEAINDICYTTHPPSARINAIRRVLSGQPNLLDVDSTNKNIRTQKPELDLL